MKHFIILTILFLDTLITSCDTITGKKDTDKNPTQQAAIALVSNQINSSSLYFNFLSYCYFISLILSSRVFANIKVI